jgi:rhombotail lipoprotein
MMRVRPLVPMILVLLLVLSAACVVHKQPLRSNALDFLYPEGTEAAPPADVELKLPVRVGIAFAPPQNTTRDTFTETQKQALLTRIAESFRDREGIASVEAIPSSFLTPKGGFENVDRLVPAFGVDLIAIVSYDQFQFSESGRSSWAYWTLIGAYVVKGEQNETRTIMNTIVYDIPSRAMLFNASGQSNIEGKSLPVQVEKALRERSEQGFEAATDDLIANLKTALDAFQVQAATGTVRGPGTPAVAMVDSSGQPVRSGGGGGAGSLALGEVFAALLLVSLAMLAKRTRKG